jgi:hypothetical protein
LTSANKAAWRNGRPKSFPLYLVLFGALALAGCQGSTQTQAEQQARDYMTIVIGMEAVSRSHVVVTRSQAGWLVVFRDAYATCDQGAWFPGACRFGRQAPYQDVYTCVPDTGEISQVGASGDRSLGDDDPCQWPSPNGTRAPAPTAAPGSL